MGTISETNVTINSIQLLNDSLHVFQDDVNVTHSAVKEEEEDSTGVTIGLIILVFFIWYRRLGHVNKNSDEDLVRLVNDSVEIGRNYKILLFRCQIYFCQNEFLFKYFYRTVIYVQIKLLKNQRINKLLLVN